MEAREIQPTGAGKVDYTFSLIPVIRGQKPVKVRTGTPYTKVLRRTDKRRLPLFDFWEPTNQNKDILLILDFDEQDLFDSWEAFREWGRAEYPQLLWTTTPSGKAKAWLRVECETRMTAALAEDILDEACPELLKMADKNSNTRRVAFIDEAMFNALSDWYDSAEVWEVESIPFEFDLEGILDSLEDDNHNMYSSSYGINLKGIDSFGIEYDELMLEAMRPIATQACFTTRVNPEKLARALAFNYRRLLKGEAMIGVRFIAEVCECSLGTASKLIRALVSNGTIELVHANFSAAAKRARVFKAGWKMLEVLEKANKKEDVSASYNVAEAYDGAISTPALLKDIRYTVAAGWTDEQIFSLVWGKLEDRRRRGMMKSPQAKSAIRNTIAAWRIKREQLRG